jgi:hypothetical protein
MALDDDDDDDVRALLRDKRTTVLFAIIPEYCPIHTSLNNLLYLKLIVWAIN